MLIYDNANDSHGFASILSQAEDEWFNQAWTDRSTNLKSKTKTLWNGKKYIFYFQRFSIHVSICLRKQLIDKMNLDIERQANELSFYSYI